ncbi:LacI family transcriptional regulator [Tropicimonas sp.]|uniref:LacI family transcriptional regulator n=1 Tax=Tropicimonas sp. TaxID=2067044 RepID=UPI003A89DFDA
MEIVAKRTGPNVSQPPDKGGKPTLRTVSRLSGFAVTTVSRALNDAPDIGDETKRIVRQVAKEIGYVPNRAGVRLRTGRTNVISLVLATHYEIMNHTAQLISSIAEGLRGTRFHLNITPYFPDQDPMEPVAYLVETRSADAILLNQTTPEDTRVKYLLERGVPFATHGRTRLGAEHSYFDFDNESFGRMAVRRLAALGRRSIVLVPGPPNQTYGGHMIHGARHEAGKCGVDLHLETTVSSDNPSWEVKESVARWLAEKPEVDAVITASSTAAIAAVTAIEDGGRSVEQEVRVLTKEAVPFLRVIRKDIIVIPENVYRAGVFLAQAAIQAINNPDAPPMQGLEELEGAAR